MTCEQRREMFLLDAIGALPALEQVELHDHLAVGCPFCAGAQAEALAVAGTLPLALDVSEQPNPATLQTLLRRIGHDVAAERFTGTRPTQAMAGRRIWPAAIAAAISAMITAGVMWNWLGESHHLLSTPDLQFVSLAGAAPQPSARGRVFWDTAHSTWLVYFFDLKPPAPGKEYELWFITTHSEKLPAGTFTVDVHGNAELSTKLPPGTPNAGTALAAVAVTDERLGGVSSPQGDIQLLGKVQ